MKDLCLRYETSADVSQLVVAPGPPELATVDELLSVSMHGSSVVIRSARQPDALGTQVFVDVVNAANAAGSTVVLRHPPAVDDSFVGAIDMPEAMEAVDASSLAAEVAGVGLLMIRTAGCLWTIDIGRDRFVRSDGTVDRWFLTAANWTAFDAMWIAPRRVCARAVDGSYVTGHRTTGGSCRRDARDDRRDVRLLSDTA